MVLKAPFSKRPMGEILLQRKHKERLDIPQYVYILSFMRNKKAALRAAFAI